MATGNGSVDPSELADGEGMEEKERGAERGRPGTAFDALSTLRVERRDESAVKNGAVAEEPVESEFSVNGERISAEGENAEEELENGEEEPVVKEKENPTKSVERALSLDVEEQEKEPAVFSEEGPTPEYGGRAKWVERQREREEKGKRVSKQKDGSYFSYMFLGKIFRESRKCKLCGARNAGKPLTDDESSLELYVSEKGVCGRQSIICSVCGGIEPVISTETVAEIPALPAYRIDGSTVRYYCKKITHYEILHDLMEMLHIAALDNSKVRKHKHNEVADFMLLNARKVCKEWCKLENTELRQRKFLRLREETLLTRYKPTFTSDHSEDYKEMYEMMAGSFRQHREKVKLILELLKTTLFDNPSQSSFMLWVSIAMMHSENYQKFKDLYDPRLYMQVDSTEYQALKDRYLALNVALGVKKIPVVFVLFELPRFYYYVEFLRERLGKDRPTSFLTDEERRTLEKFDRQARKYVMKRKIKSGKLVSAESHLDMLTQQEELDRELMYRNCREKEKSKQEEKRKQKQARKEVREKLMQEKEAQRREGGKTKGKEEDTGSGRAMGERERSMENGLEGEGGSRGEDWSETASLDSATSESFGRDVGVKSSLEKDLVAEKKTVFAGNIQPPFKSRKEKLMEEEDRMWSPIFKSRKDVLLEEEDILFERKVSPRFNKPERKVTDMIPIIVEPEPESGPRRVPPSHNQIMALFDELLSEEKEPVSFDGAEDKIARMRRRELNEEKVNRTREKEEEEGVSEKQVKEHKEEEGQRKVEGGVGEGREGGGATGGEGESIEERKEEKGSAPNEEREEGGGKVEKERDTRECGEDDGVQEELVDGGNKDGGMTKEEEKERGEEENVVMVTEETTCQLDDSSCSSDYVEAREELENEEAISFVMAAAESAQPPCVGKEEVMEEGGGGVGGGEGNGVAPTIQNSWEEPVRREEREGETVEKEGEDEEGGEEERVGESVAMQEESRAHVAEEGVVLAEVESIFTKGSSEEQQTGGGGEEEVLAIHPAATALTSEESETTRQLGSQEAAVETSSLPKEEEQLVKDSEAAMVHPDLASSSSPDDKEASSLEPSITASITGEPTDPVPSEKTMVAMETSLPGMGAAEVGAAVTTSAAAPPSGDKTQAQVSDNLPPCSSEGGSEERPSVDPNTLTPPPSDMTPPPSDMTPPPSNTLTPPPSDMTLPPSNTLTSPPSDTAPPPSNTLTPSPSDIMTPPPSDIMAPPPSTGETCADEATKLAAAVGESAHPRLSEPGEVSSGPPASSETATAGGQDKDTKSSEEGKKPTPGDTGVGQAQGTHASQTQPKSSAVKEEAVKEKTAADRQTGSGHEEKRSGKKKGGKKKARKMMEVGKSGGAENAWKPKPKPKPRLFRTPSEEALDELLRTKKDYTLDMLTPEEKYLLTSKLRRRRDPFQVEFERMVIRQAAQAKMEKDRRERIEALKPRAVLEAKTKTKASKRSGAASREKVAAPLSKESETKADKVKGKLAKTTAEKSLPKMEPVKPKSSAEQSTSASEATSSNPPQPKPLEVASEKSKMKMLELAQPTGPENPRLLSANDFHSMLVDHLKANEEAIHGQRLSAPLPVPAPSLPPTPAPPKVAKRKEITSSSTASPPPTSSSASATTSSSTPATPQAPPPKLSKKAKREAKKLLRKQQRQLLVAQVDTELLRRQGYKVKENSKMTTVICKTDGTIEQVLEDIETPEQISTLLQGRYNIVSQGTGYISVPGSEETGEDSEMEGSLAKVDTTKGPHISDVDSGEESDGGLSGFPLTSKWSKEKRVQFKKTLMSGLGKALPLGEPPVTASSKVKLEGDSMDEKEEEKKEDIDLKDAKKTKKERRRAEKIAKREEEERQRLKERERLKEEAEKARMESKEKQQREEERRARERKREEEKEEERQELERIVAGKTEMEGKKKKKEQSRDKGEHGCVLEAEGLTGRGQGEREGQVGGKVGAEHKLEERPNVTTDDRSTPLKLTSHPSYITFQDMEDIEGEKTSQSGSLGAFLYRAALHTNDGNKPPVKEIYKFAKKRQGELDVRVSVSEVFAKNFEMATLMRPCRLSFNCQLTVRELHPPCGEMALCD